MRLVYCALHSWTCDGHFFIGLGDVVLASDACFTVDKSRLDRKRLLVFGPRKLFLTRNIFYQYSGHHRLRFAKRFPFGSVSGRGALCLFFFHPTHPRAYVNGQRRVVGNRFGGQTHFRAEPSTHVCTIYTSYNAYMLACTPYACVRTHAESTYIFSPPLTPYQPTSSGRRTANDARLIFGDVLLPEVTR
jgi:hypothetical protein